MAEQEPKELTLAQFTDRLPDGDKIHTVRSTSVAQLGADWDRAALLKLAEDCQDRLELAGPIATSMGHGLIIWTKDPNAPLFVEHKQDGE